jgi:type VI secretion system protein ImpL
VVLAIVVFLILLFFGAVIWGAGLYFGLALATKLVLSAIVVGGILVALLVRYLLQLQASSRLEKGLVAAGEKEIETAKPDRRKHLADQQQKFVQAIVALKNARIARGSGKTALYLLPWYVIVGPPGAGKTTAIKESGLDFPLENGSSVRGMQGTRDCDFWFTNDAVLVDTAGRFATDDSDQQEWFGFLDLLRRFRPRKPINGLIVALSITDLAGAESAAIGALAKQMRARLDEVTRRLKMRVPIYVVLTKTDMVAGFADFWGDLAPSERGQVWGATFPLTLHAEPKESFEREFDLITQTLFGRMTKRLHDERRPSQRRALWTFPQEFTALRPHVSTFVSALFAKNSFQETPLLRGVYFSSGTQTARPSSRILASLGSSYGLRLPPDFGRVEPKSYFLTDVFRRVMFADRDVAGQTEAEKRRQLLVRIAVAASAVTLAALLFVPAFATSLRNRELVNTTTEVGASIQAVNWQTTTTLGKDATRLDGAQALLHQLDEWKTNGAPVHFRWGMFMGDRLFGSLRGVYTAALWRLVIQPARAHLEDKLRGMDGSPVRSREHFNDDLDTLKLYLMLGDSGHMDAKWAAPRLVREWTQTERAHAQAGDEDLVLPHVAYVFDLLARGEVRPWECDKTLVDRARSVLSQVPQKERLYDTLVRDANAELPPIRREAIFYGSVAPFVQSRKNVRVPGAYTKLGWIRVRALLGEEREKLAAEQWVLAETITGGAASVIGELRTLYFERYQNAWRDFLLDFQVQDPGNAEIALDELNALAEPEWPYLRLVRVLSDNVTLDVEDPKGLVDQAIDKAKELGLDAGPPKRAVSPVERAFRPVLRFGLGAGSDPAAADSGPVTGLSQYEALLAKLVGALTDLRDSESGSDPRKVSDVFQDAVRGASALLSEQDGFTRPLLSPLLINPISLAWGSVVRDAGGAISANWESSAWAKWHDKLEGKYPFVQTSAEAPLADFLDFFAPGDGVLWSFYDESLKATLDHNGSSFAPSRRFRSSVAYAPDFLDVCLRRGDQITKVLFPPKAGHAEVGFSVNLHSVSPTIGEVTFEVDGASYTYRNEPEQWLPVVWPGKGAAHGARLMVQGTGGLHEEISRPSDFGLFRLLDTADIKPGRAGGRSDGARGDLGASSRARRVRQPGHSSDARREPARARILQGLRVPARDHDPMMPDANRRTVAHTMETTSPMFEHDCDLCTFLGECRGHDLYFCDKCFTAGPTLIARYGSEGKQYTSGLELAAVDPLLAEARRRAIARGLLPA